MDDVKMITIDLSLVQDPDCLILLCRSGVVYTNQTGGMSCIHPAVEGAAIPFENSYAMNEIQVVLRDLCRGGFSKKLIDYCNSIFDDYNLPLVVDENCVDQSCEAWLYVKVDHNRTKLTNLKYSIFENINNMTCVLTWENSD